MFILLTGGNASGKSLFAERIAAGIPSRRFYAATMIPFGPEGEARRAKHLRQRAGLNFITVECPRGLDEIGCGPGDLVLLEDVSNLLANLTFGEKIPDAAETAFRQIAALKKRCAVLLAVTIGGLDGAGCDEETRAYAASLCALNDRLATEADVVIEMRGGKPLLQKGEFSWSG